MPGFFEIPKDFFTCVREVEVGARRRIFFVVGVGGQAGWLVVGSVVGRIWKRRKGEKREIE